MISIRFWRATERRQVAPVDEGGTTGPAHPRAHWNGGLRRRRSDWHPDPVGRYWSAESSRIRSHEQGKIREKREI